MLEFRFLSAPSSASLLFVVLLFCFLLLECFDPTTMFVETAPSSPAIAIAAVLLTILREIRIQLLSVAKEEKSSEMSKVVARSRHAYAGLAQAAFGGVGWHGCQFEPARMERGRK